MKENRVVYADDDTEPVRLLFRMRIVALVFGLLLGVGLSFITSKFEEVLSQNVSVVFFIPFIVYVADAVGTQTQNIYVRDLRTGRAKFKKYLIKEGVLGPLFGICFAAVAMPVVWWWFKSGELAVAVGAALMGAVSVAPMVALGVTEVLRVERSDPAVGAGPIATVIQDAISVVIYGAVASAILL